MQINIALLTITDTRTFKNDKSGGILVKKIAEQKHKLIDRKIVKDEKKEIKKILSEWIKKDNIDVIITTGGTGLTGRDITPEAINTPVKRANIANKNLVNWTSLSRLTRSAKAPPHTDNTKTGARVAVLVRPTINGESVRECINQSRP